MAPQSQSVSRSNPWERRAKWIAQQLGTTTGTLGTFLDSAMRSQTIAGTPAQPTAGRAGAGTGQRSRTRTRKRTTAAAGAGT